MSMKSVCPCALVLILLGVSAVRGQYTMPLADGPGSAEPVPAPRDVTPQPGAQPFGRLSSWITYAAPECCGPLGGKPIGTELYWRTGASIPAFGKVFDDTLDTGWDIQGGARILFFNHAVDAAWALDLSISNISNHGQSPQTIIPIRTPVPGPTTQFGPGPDVLQTVPTTISNLNRTFVNFGLGRDWYVTGTADDPGRKCRVGCDGGFRWGTAKAEFHEIRHRTDVITGAFAGIHADAEIPLGCCIFQVGVRAEWAYNWMDNLLDTNDESLQDINLLFTIGVRF